MESKELKYAYLESPFSVKEEHRVSNMYNCFKDYASRDKLFIQDVSGLFEYDFCNGFRIHFYDDTIAYMLTISDAKGQMIYKNVLLPKKDCIYAYSKIYCIDYIITLSYYDYVAPQMPPFRIIRYNPNNQPVGIYISYNNQSSEFGDTIAWTNSILYYAEKYNKAQIKIIGLDPNVEKFFIENTNIPNYKNISFSCNINEENRFYAQYYFGYYNIPKLKISKERFNYYKEFDCCDGLLKNGLDILNIEGIDGYREKPKITLRNIPKIKMKNPYVCISTNASSFYKKWLNDDGWQRVIEYLNYLGYDIYCIDNNKFEIYNDFIKMTVPDGVIDDTGNKSIAERAEMIANCEFFIGLSSDLSWLAWLCDVPVVLISGFSKPKTEFYTPYRIINYNVCNGCWNEFNQEWNEYTCCPLYGNNVNETNFLICSLAIRSETVIKTVNEIPSVKKRLKNE